MHAVSRNFRIGRNSCLAVFGRRENPSLLSNPSKQILRLLSYCSRFRTQTLRWLTRTMADVTSDVDLSLTSRVYASRISRLTFSELKRCKLSLVSYPVKQYTACQCAELKFSCFSFIWHCPCRQKIVDSGVFGTGGILFTSAVLWKLLQISRMDLDSLERTSRVSSELYVLISEREENQCTKRKIAENTAIFLH